MLIRATVVLSLLLATTACTAQPETATTAVSPITAAASVVTPAASTVIAPDVATAATAAAAPARIQQLLNKSNATQSELAEAKRLISSLNGDIDGYKEQVAVLQQQKTQLISEKAVVVSQRDKVQRNYDSSTLVIKQKEDIINVGSTLHASNFNIVGIHEKKSGKEKTTSTAKRVDKLRISFDLDENMLSESGAKEIYVCITAPDGSPVAVQALGSGTFNTRLGEEKPYTQKLDVNYTQNKKQSVSFDWKQGTNFTTGNYKIEVYNNGFKVGEGYKPLRKGGLFS